MDVQPPAIVLAADTNGLGVVRCLWKKDIKSIVIVRSGNDVTLSSRLPIQKYIVDGEAQLLELLDSLKGRGLPIVPTSDWFVSFVSAYRAQLVAWSFRFCIVSPEIADALIDKGQETKILEALVPMPLTCQDLPRDAQTLIKKVGLPIIFKPRSFKHDCLGSKNKQVNSFQQLEAFYAEYSDILDTLVAQEIIEGPDSRLWVCNCTFNKESDLLCSFTFRRLRLSPPHFGVTSYAVSEKNDQVTALARLIGKKLRYVGPAMVEFKYDVRDGSYKYIELNPRVGMCNYFDAECGINNVYASYLVALDRPLGEVSRVQRNGVIYVDVYDDLYARIKCDKEPISRVVKHYLSDIGKKHVFAIFVWYDLGPAFKRLVSIFGIVAKKLMKITRLN